jgi:hypothetical protein
MARGRNSESFWQQQLLMAERELHKLAFGWKRAVGPPDSPRSNPADEAEASAAGGKHRPRQPVIKNVPLVSYPVPRELSNFFL